MDDAINILQDRIIMLRGMIVVIDEDSISEIAKTVCIKGWNREIKQLRRAQEILSES